MFALLTVLFACSTSTTAEVTPTEVTPAAGAVSTPSPEGSATGTTTVTPTSAPAAGESSVCVDTSDNGVDDCATSGASAAPAASATTATPSAH